jgi:arylsulfatase A-like enzyme
MRIIYVDVDTLRADHTSPYGYHRDTTPNLRGLAERSVVFDRYYCSDSPCLPSRTALTSGQFGITNGVIGHFGEAARFRLDSGHGPHPHRPLLGQRLQQGGYYTAAVSMFAERHRAYHFLGNFRESIRASDKLNDEEAHEVNAVAIDWIRRHAAEDNWYLHLTYWDPHTPYLAPAEYSQRAAALGPPPEWPDQATIEAHAEVYGPRGALDLHYFVGPRAGAPEAIRGRADFEQLIDDFDGSIVYWDEHFGELLRALDELGIRESTAIIVSADHGEAFGENGMYAEHGFANEPVQRVPLIISWPGLTDSPRRNSSLLYHIDLAPTLCDLLDIPIPEGWQGESFADAIRGDEIGSREYLVLGQGAHTYQRAVRTRDHLYIRTFHPGAYRAEWEQCFDVTNDPHLTHDLLPDQPELGERMRARLAEWTWTYAGGPGALPDPMMATLNVGPVYYNDPARYVEHLRATGRGHLADDLERRLAAVPGATRVSWHAPDEPWPPGRHAALARQFNVREDPA